MKQLIRFELRKVLQNRLALISIAAVLLLSIALSLSFAISSAPKR